MVCCAQGSRQVFQIMPVEVSSSKPDFGALPGSGIGRMGSNDSGIGPAFMDPGSDDDYMSREEKECIQFFETTLDSLSDGLELSNLSGEAGEEEEDEGRATPTLSHTQIHPHPSSEEIIDLVKDSRHQLEECETNYVKPIRYMNVSEILPKEEVEPESPGLDQRRASLVSPRQSFDWPLPPPDIGPPASPQPIGSVPTPLVIAQRIAENGSLSPTSPIFPSPPPLGVTDSKAFHYHNGRSNPTSPTESREPQHRPLSQGSFKHQRFPSNINVSVGNREYNSTITKASVNIQERKARVLANLGSAAGRLALESDERQQRARLWASSRSTSFKELGSGQARNEALSKLGLAKEPEETPLHNGSPAKLRIAGFSHSLKVKPTVSAAGETSPPLRRASTSKLDLPSPSEVPPPAFLSPSPGPFHPELRRLSSTPRPSGLRTPGITVQFSGRGSTDESRREALRKLGLLKSQ
eukprot:gi/632978299/ref/XP_007905831.1/ PREDICTED: proline and serine-rich protein 2 isoform X1 [Callorhinchus milii]